MQPLIRVCIIQFKLDLTSTIHTHSDDEILFCRLLGDNNDDYFYE